MRIVMSALTLIISVMPGAGQTHGGFAKGIGPIIEIEKINLRSGVTFQIVKGKSGLSGQVVLPMGSRPGIEPRVFVGPRGGVVSVHIELEGDAAGKMFTDRATHPAELGEHLVLAGPWLGAFEERPLSDNLHIGRLYSMISSRCFYTMMISWPIKDSVVKEDAETLARSVIWSFKLDSHGKRRGHASVTE